MACSILPNFKLEGDLAVPLPIGQLSMKSYLLHRFKFFFKEVRICKVQRKILMFELNVLSFSMDPGLSKKAGSWKNQHLFHVLACRYFAGLLFGSLIQKMARSPTVFSQLNARPQLNASLEKTAG